MENSRIAKIFDEIADLLVIRGGNPFRIRSYRRAARTLRDLPKRVEDMEAEGEDLSDLPNIGEGTSKKIREILERGTAEKLERLREKVPPELPELLKVPGLGPKRATKLHRELDIESLEDLRKAGEQGKVRQLEGFGKKTESKILDGIEKVSSKSGRMLYREAEEYAKSLGEHLEGLESVGRFTIAGSFRRRKETVGDLDILVQAAHREKAAEQILGHPEIGDVIGRGEEKVSVWLKDGPRVDFRFFDSNNYGAALMYFTGSKAHNISVRERARGKGWKLNEYGLFRGDKFLAGESEDELYEKLKLSFIPPELREDRGEIEAAEKDELPDLIELGEIQGDLHCHTDATDGKAGLREMARAARDKGYKYLALTDHTKALPVAGGLDEEGTLKRAGEIRELDGKMDGIRLLAGAEVDILEDGSLDLGEDALAELDWVIASVHTNLGQDDERLTERIVTALESGHVHCFAHPMERLIGEREPLAFDRGKVFKACGENGVCVEINGQPERMDLPAAYCREAIEAGVEFSLATDAHSADQLEFMRFAVNNARRGWVDKGHVVNALSEKQLIKRFKV